MASKHLINELKILKIFGNSVLSIFNVMCLIYVDSPFHVCFMTFLMYTLDVFIGQMALWCK